MLVRCRYVSPTVPQQRHLLKTAIGCQQVVAIPSAIVLQSVSAVVAASATLVAVDSAPSAAVSTSPVGRRHPRADAYPTVDAAGGGGGGGHSGVDGSPADAALAAATWPPTPGRPSPVQSLTRRRRHWGGGGKMWRRRLPLSQLTGIFAARKSTATAAAASAADLATTR